MRVVIACGGTGGHFYPGYVLGKKLRERGHEVLFVLRREDPAADRLRAEDLPFTELDLSGLPRKPGLGLLVFLWKLAQSLRVARNLVRSFRPSACAGMGGYLSFPLAAASRLAGVPVLLHESNSVLGLANRISLPAASTLALGLPLARAPRSSVKIALTGTPIRPELWTRGEPGEARRGFGLDPGKTTLLVFGGSQGARALNRLALQALRLLGARKPGALQALHLTGRAEEAGIREAYQGIQGLRVCVRGYLAEMRLAYAAADLTLCRAGASTLAELAAQRMPALLVPYPSAAAGHQEANARVLERAGAAQVLLEQGLTAEGLAERIEELLLKSAGGGGRMAEGYGNLRLPEPARSPEALAQLVEELL